MCLDKRITYNFKLLITLLILIYLLMKSRRHSEIIKQRAVRHNRLMKLIKSYNPSEQQTKKLERIKINTMMEINIRFLKSDHNRHYRFLKKNIENDQDSDEDTADQLITKKENILYDLRSQNELQIPKSLSQKIITLDNSRKVASLEVDRNNYQRERLLRLHLKSTKQLSSKSISRKNSIVDRSQKDNVKLRLPQLRLEKSKEHLKTQGRYAEDENDLREIIGKKLVTEIVESPSRLKGVQKYLKKMQERSKQNEAKSNFRKKIFVPDRY